MITLEVQDGELYETGDQATSSELKESIVEAVNRVSDVATQTDCSGLDEDTENESQSKNAPRKTVLEQFGFYQALKEIKRPKGKAGKREHKPKIV